MSGTCYGRTGVLVFASHDKIHAVRQGDARASREGERRHLLLGPPLDVEIVIDLVAFGIGARIARTTAETLRKQGVKAGCFRPITLNPFPREQLAAAAKGRKILTLEIDAGQFADDVRLNLAKAGLGAEAAAVKMIHRMGGEVVTVDDAVKAAKELL